MKTSETLNSTKETYVSPKYEVIQLETEGVIACSGMDFENGGDYDRPGRYSDEWDW